MRQKKPRNAILKELRIEKGESPEQVAEAVGISSSSIRAYESDPDKDISLYALCLLAEHYNVTTDYILGLTSNRKEFNTPVEKLHLTDEALQAITGGDYNTWLLSEMIAHPAFRRMMIDAEIYVDRMAEQNIQAMNSYLEALRQSFVDQAGADPDDLWMSTLKAGQVEEDEYFGHVIHNDVMEILKDIREKHKPDPETADSPHTEEIAKAVEEAKSLAGTPLELKIRYMCSKLNIPYGRYTTEEFAAFIKILESVPDLSARLGISNRGKSPNSRRRRK